MSHIYTHTLAHMVSSRRLFLPVRLLSYYLVLVTDSEKYKMKNPVCRGLRAANNQTASANHKVAITILRERQKRRSLFFSHANAQPGSESLVNKSKQNLQSD